MCICFYASAQQCFFVHTDTCTKTFKTCLSLLTAMRRDLLNACKLKPHWKLQFLSITLLWFFCINKGFSCKWLLTATDVSLNIDFSSTFYLTPRWLSYKKGNLSLSDTYTFRMSWHIFMYKNRVKDKNRGTSSTKWEKRGLVRK